MKRVPSLDGLCAISIVLVVLGHLASRHDIYWEFWHFYANTGVRIFFVISGYLITGIIQSEVKSGAFSLNTLPMAMAACLRAAGFFCDSRLNASGSVKPCLVCNRPLARSTSLRVSKRSESVATSFSSAVTSLKPAQTTRPPLSSSRAEWMRFRILEHYYRGKENMKRRSPSIMPPSKSIPSWLQPA